MTNGFEKEFSSYMRFFCTRMVQAVVQARMCKMQPSPCVLANQDQPIWFNLVMDEIGEIAAYLKSTLGRSYPPECSVFTLEFILFTADGDKLPLETWVVRLDKECGDESVNVRTTLYQQMSTLLKSIIIASRFTPAYRHFVCKQGPDTFVIIYRVFDGEPNLSVLGEEQKCKRLGYLPTPFGALSVELYLRTKMEIQPQPFVPEFEGIAETIEACKSIGVAIPADGSQLVPVSPSSIEENINLFSTSPISQDLPLREAPKFTLGSDRQSSFCSIVAAIDPNSTATSGTTKSDPTTMMSKGSPVTSNSFPQHNSMHHKLRVRNNSFPFSSLLLYSRSSSDQLKVLPNVPEDVALNTNIKTTTLGSDFSLDVNDKTATAITDNSSGEMRRNSSIGIEMIGFNTDDSSIGCGENRLETSRAEKDFDSLNGQPISNMTSMENKNEQHQDSAAGCSEVLKQGRCEDLSDKKVKRETEYKLNGKNDEAESENVYDDEDDDVLDDADSSDNSYVKVITFGDGTDAELGTDLSEFFKEVRFAPDKLLSFGSDEKSAELKDQLVEFRQQESSFNQFVCGLREEEETGRQQDNDLNQKGGTC